MINRRLIVFSPIWLLFSKSLGGNQMGAIVQPNYGQWLQQFPEFGTLVNSVQYANYFNMATLFVRNDGGGLVDLSWQQALFLSLVTAHIAKLFAANPDGSQPAGTQLVGRISSATEGSVSVQTDVNTTENEGWYAQTQYGWTFWRASAIYRTMRYAPPQNQRVFNPWKWRI
jgi:Protein of unknown function (DUF4054)